MASRREKRHDNTLERRNVVAEILKDRGDALVVTGLGSPSWDTAAAGDNANNFYLWGGMGGAAMVGLGLALAQPDRRVLVITGDGEQLMALGSLATIRVQEPANLALIVIDNECYGETGGQPSHTAYGVALARIAATIGFAVTATVYVEKEFKAIVPKVYRETGPIFFNIKVKLESLPISLPPRDGTLLKNRFRQAVFGNKVST